MRPPLRLPELSALCRRCQSTVAAADVPANSPAPRLRFAPSPTGYLHLGGLRTALVNHLLARKGKGKWILRIEDTDQARLVPGAVDALRRSLDWVGLEYDEGVGAGGSYGPYVQSERRGLYHQHVKTLLENDKAYHCFCSADDLVAIRKSLQTSGSRQTYDGRCRHLPAEEVARLKASGKQSIIRFKDPGRMPSMPKDLVFGEITAHTDTGFENNDDFVLMKSDGYPTYHLANVIDDHEMLISHVVRGEEWLSSLPKHIALYEAFGWAAPTFAHLPLLVNEKGAKLSKRNDDVGVDSFKAKGYEPEALLNFVGLLGWDYRSSLEKTYGSDLPVHVRRDSNSLYEIFTLPQLIDAFDISQLSRRKVQVNIDKLDFVNKMTLRVKAGQVGLDDAIVNLGKSNQRLEWKKRQEDGLYSLLRRFREDLQAVPEIKESPLLNDERYIERIFTVELPRVIKLNEMAGNVRNYFIRPNYDSPESLEFFSNVAKFPYVRNLEFVSQLLLDFKDGKARALTPDDGWSIIKVTAVDLNLTIKREVVKQLRHALMGQREGPSVPEIMAILGVDEVLERVRNAIEWVDQRVGRQGAGKQ